MAVDAVIDISMVILPKVVLMLQISLITFIFILIAGIVAFLTANLNASSYAVEEDYLIVDWSKIRQAVQLGRKQTIINRTDSDAKIRIRRISWVDVIFRRGQSTKSIGESIHAIVDATCSRDQKRLLICPGLTIAGSTVDLPRFSASLRAFWKPSAEIVPEKPAFISDMSFLDRGIWRDRLPQISLGFSFNLFGLQSIIINLSLNELPGSLPLHFDEVDQPAQLRSPSGIHTLFLIGVVTWTDAMDKRGLFLYFSGTRNTSPISFDAYQLPFKQ
jgi:hypothetical protein